jgi:hypothetical protein
MPRRGTAVMSLAVRSCAVAIALASGAAVWAAGLEFVVDPVTRYVRVSYPVPAGAPDVVVVRAEHRACGSSQTWQPAPVWAWKGATAERLTPRPEWEAGIWRGELAERLAAGLRRTLVWNPVRFGSARICVDFRVTVGDGPLWRGETRIELDNSDVVLLDQWDRVIQQGAVSPDPAPGAARWWLRSGQAGPHAPLGGRSLEVKEKRIELPPLTYPLNLKGPYAMFVALPPKLGGVELRLSGDERAQWFSESRPGAETFWRWDSLTRQHLVIQQPYRTVYEYEDGFRAHLDYVRLVPLPAALAAQLDAEAAEAGERKLVAGYNEPYSWAFYEKVTTNLQHVEPLLAFAEARVDIVDTQFGRAGAKLVFESRAGEQLLAETMGDPVRGAVPRTSNVGRMQQYTNMLATQARHARRLGMRFFANLGATNCYPGSPLQADFCRDHPEWRVGNTLRYDVAEVRRYVLALFEEALEIGVDGVSIDWCRYPHSIRDKDTVTTFFRELRALVNRFGEAQGRRIPILTRFPARGVPGAEFMDYAAWVREGLIDYLAPSNIQARHLTFELAEYRQAVRGTAVRLLPCVDALHWGLPFPDMWLERVLHLYEQDADGVYVYQADAPTLGSPEDRRALRRAGSLASLRRWRQERDRLQTSYSKGVYLTKPAEGPAYHRWERVRVWVEGFRPQTVELWVDGKRVNRYAAPPYVLYTEDRSADEAMTAGRHVLTVRAEDGGRWLEKEFAIEFAP